ncbi:MarR family winged helix-turn-helix transcriptional regulator [Mycolicibacterium sp. J2]|uniref:MarR family winged helix-turn-helix transcriptional regulator n=1 Tax=Mycolicibacterium sp. J2 TaxID=2993511 RepID=UPI00224B9025|nr:MarR family transcriptional regulator [Mycolicibacterium sp. J2]MCX2710974.1 MarR family transcriptional regulator [Mycolicibacterium sp. J2]
MANSASEGIAAASVATAVLRASRRLSSQLEAALQDDGLGIDHWLTMEALASGDGLTMADLQTATLTPGPTLTRVVDKLVTHSAAYREVDALDRRKVRVYLSAHGAELHERLGRAIASAESQWLDSDGAELAQALFGRAFQRR